MTRQATSTLDELVGVLNLLRGERDKISQKLIELGNEIEAIKATIELLEKDRVAAILPPEGK